jgi:hypothetical protein
LIDKPSAREIVAIVATFLRTVAVPSLSGAASFEARVAANALDLVGRELGLALDADRDAQKRLADILDQDADVASLEALLVARLNAETIDENTPKLIDYFWADVLAKLAIDQPNYASYKAELAVRKERSSIEEKKEL